jgi:hypothetical protein
METLFKILGRQAGKFAFYLKNHKVSRILFFVICISMVSYWGINKGYQMYRHHEAVKRYNEPIPMVAAKVCAKCGKDITNRQAAKVADGQYECVACFTQDRREKERQTETEYASDGQSCRVCGTGRYSGGFCNLCGAASPDRVQESNSNAPNCEYCQGAGVIKTGGMHDHYKVCPSCKGSGKQTY